MSRPIDHEQGTGSLSGTNNFSAVAIESPPEHANTRTGLHTAVKRGDLDEVRRILIAQSNWWCTKKCLITKMDENGMCPVHIAAKEGRHDIMKEFVQITPNCINVRGKDYKTALHFAVEHGQLEVVKVLLSDQKAKMGRKMVSHDYDKDGNTALHLAVIHGVEPQVVRELLRWPGVSVNEINKEGLTALEIAAHSSKISSEDDMRTKCAEIKSILEAIGGCGKYSRQSEGKESKIVDVDTVVASLIATITFAAIFQIPGGIEDQKSSAQYGGARYGTSSLFLWFSIFNTLALFTSLTVVIVWLLRERSGTELIYEHGFKVAGLSAICLGISIVCTGLAFICAYVLIIIPYGSPSPSPSPSPSEEYTPSLSEEESSAYLRLISCVIGAACFSPVIAWTSFLGIVISKFYTSVFRRKPNGGLFPKSVLCTWLFIALIAVPLMLYIMFK